MRSFGGCWPIRMLSEPVIGADMTSRSQRVARQACAHLVVDEVLMRECAVLTVRFVDDKDMRRDSLLVDQTINNCCSVNRRAVPEPR